MVRYLPAPLLTKEGCQAKGGGEGKTFRAMGLDFRVEALELLVRELIELGEIDIVRGAARVFVGDGDPEELLELVGLDHGDGVPGIPGTGLGALVTTDAFIKPDLNRRDIPMDGAVGPLCRDLLGGQV